MTQTLTEEQKLARRILIQLEEILCIPENKKMTSTHSLANPPSNVNNSQISPEEKAIDSYLDGIRLYVKYLSFDTEATRRENNYLRKMLEEQNNED